MCNRWIMPKINRQLMTRQLVSLPQTLNAEIVALAASRGCSVSEVARGIFAEWFDARKANKEPEDQQRLEL